MSTSRIKTIDDLLLVLRERYLKEYPFATNVLSVLVNQLPLPASLEGVYTFCGEDKRVITEDNLKFIIRVDDDYFRITIPYDSYEYTHLVLDAEVEKVVPHQRSVTFFEVSE